MLPTLSLSTVFWDVLEAIEMVSGWLLPSPWLSPSSPPSLNTQTIRMNIFAQWVRMWQHWWDSITTCGQSVLNLRKVSICCDDTFHHGDKVSACSATVYSDDVSSCGNSRGGKKSSPKSPCCISIWGTIAQITSVLLAVHFTLTEDLLSQWGTVECGTFCTSVEQVQIAEVH